MAQSGRPGFNPWVGQIPWRRKWQPTPVVLPGESYRQRSLAGYSLWGHKESDMTESLALSEVLNHSICSAWREVSSQHSPLAYLWLPVFSAPSSCSFFVSSILLFLLRLLRPPFPSISRLPHHPRPWLAGAPCTPRGKVQALKHSAALLPLWLWSGWLPPPPPDSFLAPSLSFHCLPD